MLRIAIVIERVTLTEKPSFPATFPGMRFSQAEKSTLFSTVVPKWSNARDRIKGKTKRMKLSVWLLITESLVMTMV